MKQKEEACVLHTNDASIITEYKVPFDIEMSHFTVITKADTRGLVRFYMYNNNNVVWSSDRIQLKKGVKNLDTKDLKLRAGSVIKLLTTNNIASGSTMIMSGNTAMNVIHHSYWQAYLKTKGTIHQISGGNVNLLYAPMYEKTKLTHISISANMFDINGGVEIILGTGRMVIADDPTKKNITSQFVVANENKIDQTMDMLYPIVMVFGNNQSVQSIDISSKNIIIEPDHCLYIESLSWTDNKRIQMDSKTNRSIGVFHIHIIGVSAV